jgi:hypothetical protein
MRVSLLSVVFVAAAVVAAIPFGWGLGVIVAWLVAGPDFGQLPAVTIGVTVLASVAFAVLPIFRPQTRLAILVVGAVVFIAIARTL